MPQNQRQKTLPHQKDDGREQRIENHVLPHVKHVRPRVHLHLRPERRHLQTEHPPSTSVSWRTNVSTHKCQYARRTPSPGQWARTPSVVTYPMTPGPPRGQELRPKLPHSRFITRERERSPRRDRSGPSRGRSSTPRLVGCPRRASVPRSRALFRRPRQHHAKRPPPRSRRTPRRIYGWMCR